METIVSIGLMLLMVYLAVGIVVALLLHRQLVRLDPAADGAGWLFRVLITPGMVALWPVLLVAWRRTRSGAAFAAPTEGLTSMGRLRAVHGLLIMVVTVVVGVVIGLALMARPDLPASDSLPAWEGQP